MDNPLGWLESLPRYSQIRYNLFRFNRLLVHFELDYRQLPVFVLTGSNGKGTAAVTLAGILKEAGFNPGLYTSPHLYRFNERISVAGQEIGSEELNALLSDIRNNLPVLPVMYGGWIHSEILTLAALMHFRNSRADVLVLEAGLGGRLDPVNLFPQPLAVGITSISLEHKGILGETEAEIAGEKAGCIKRGRPLVTAADGAALAVIARRARLMGAKLITWNQDFRWDTELVLPDRTIAPCDTPLTVAARQNRALAACMAVQAFPELPTACLSKLNDYSLPGRFEIVDGSPPIVLDVAHNPEAITNLLQGLKRRYGAARIGFVFGALSDKPIEPMLKLLADTGPVWFAPVADARGAKPLASPGVAAVNSVAQGLEAAELHRPDVICVTGSFSVVRQVRPLL